MSFEENIKKNNIVLPNAADPVGAYVAAKIVNNYSTSLVKFQWTKMVN